MSDDSDEVMTSILDWFGQIGDWIPGAHSMVGEIILGPIPLSDANQVYNLADQWAALAEQLNAAYEDVMLAANPILENWSGDEAAAQFVQQWFAYLEGLRQTAAAAAQMQQGVQSFGLEVELMKFMAALNLIMLAVSLFMLIAAAIPSGGGSLLAAPGLFAACRIAIGKAVTVTLTKITSISLRTAIPGIARLFTALPGAVARTAPALGRAVPHVAGAPFRAIGRISVNRVAAGRAAVATGRVALASARAAGVRGLPATLAGGARHIAAQGISKAVANRLAAQSMRVFAQNELRGALASQSVRAVQRQLSRDIQQQLMARWAGRELAQAGQTQLTRLAAQQATRVTLGREFAGYVGTRVAFGAGFMGGGNLLGQFGQIASGNRTDGVDWGQVTSNAAMGAAFGAGMYGGPVGHVIGGSAAGGLVATGQEAYNHYVHGQEFNWANVGHGAVQGAAAGVIFGGQTHLEMSSLGGGRMRIGEDVHVLPNDRGGLDIVSSRAQNNESLVLTSDGYVAWQGKDGTGGISEGLRDHLGLEANAPVPASVLHHGSSAAPNAPGRVDTPAAGRAEAPAAARAEASAAGRAEAPATGQAEASAAARAEASAAGRTEAPAAGRTDTSAPARAGDDSSGDGIRRTTSGATTGDGVRAPDPVPGGDRDGAGGHNVERTHGDSGTPADRTSTDGSTGLRSDGNGSTGDRVPADGPAGERTGGDRPPTGDRPGDGAAAGDRVSVVDGGQIARDPAEPVAADRVPADRVPVEDGGPPARSSVMDGGVPPRDGGSLAHGDGGAPRTDMRGAEAVNGRTGDGVPADHAPPPHVPVDRSTGNPTPAERAPASHAPADRSAGHRPADGAVPAERPARAGTGPARDGADSSRVPDEPSVMRPGDTAAAEVATGASTRPRDETRAYPWSGEAYDHLDSGRTIRGTDGEVPAVPQDPRGRASGGVHLRFPGDEPPAGDRQGVSGGNSAGRDGGSGLRRGAGEDPAIPRREHEVPGERSVRGVEPYRLADDSGPDHPDAPLAAAEAVDPPQDVTTGGTVRPRDEVRAFDWADQAYDRFRADDGDVADIVRNLGSTPRLDGGTGYTAAEIGAIKQHLMVERHPIEDYDGGVEMRRFDADPDIAEAWIRLREGRPLPEDLILLHHEQTEARYLAGHPGSTYQQAHRYANERYNWQDARPGRTGENLDTAWGSTRPDGDSAQLPQDPRGRTTGGVPLRFAGDGPAAGDRQGVPGGEPGGGDRGPGLRGGAGEDPAVAARAGELAGGRGVRGVDPYRLVDVPGPLPERPVAAPREVAAALGDEMTALVEGREPGRADQPHRAEWDPETRTMRVRYGDGVEIDVVVQVNESVPPGRAVVVRPPMESLDGGWRQTEPAGVVLSPHVPADPAARLPHVQETLGGAWRTLHGEVGDQLRIPARAADGPPPPDGLPRSDGSPPPDGLPRSDGPPPPDGPPPSDGARPNPDGVVPPPDAPPTVREAPRPDALRALEQPVHPDVPVRDAEAVGRHEVTPAEPPRPPDLTSETVRQTLTGRGPEQLARWSGEHLATRTDDGTLRPRPDAEIDATVARLADEALDRITPRPDPGGEPVGRADVSSGPRHTDSPIEGTAHVPDGRAPHLPDVSVRELQEAARGVVGRDFADGAVRSLTPDGPYVRVEMADGGVQHFLPRVGEGMANVAETAVRAGTPEDPHVVTVNHRTAPDQLSRVWVHEITETLAMRHAAETRPQPHGLARRAMTVIGRLFGGGDRAAETPRVDPHTAARLNERLHLQRQHDSAQGRPEEQARLRDEIRGVERDLTGLGYPVERTRSLFDGLPEPPLLRDGVIGGRSDALPGHEPVPRDSAPAHEPVAHDPVQPRDPEPSVPPESDHAAHWADPAWERENRPPSFDELIPLTDAEAARFAGRVEAEFRRQVEGRDYNGFTVRFDDSNPHRITVDRNSVTLRLDVHDQNGYAGRTIRVFERDADGSLFVTHSSIHLEARAQGRGFAQSWNGFLESWYRYSGVDHVEVHAVNRGAYAWARDGYDWAPNTRHRADAILDRVHAGVRAIDEHLGQLAQWQRGERPLDVDALLRRYGVDHPDQLADRMRYERDAGNDILDRADRHAFGSRDYPSPNDISRAGSAGRFGRDQTWVGKEALLGGDWKGVKPITDGVVRHPRVEPLADRSITAAAVPRSDFHGGARDVPAPEAVRAIARTALDEAAPRLGGLRTDLDVVPADRLPDGAVARSVPVDGQGRDLPAGRTPPPDGGYRIEVSDRAGDLAVPRAIAHEAAELGAVRDRAENGLQLDGPDVLRPGEPDGPLPTRGDLSPHDIGRLAERDHLTRLAEDPQHAAYARRELDLLDRHLGLHPDDPGAAARLQAIDDHRAARAADRTPEAPRDGDRPTQRLRMLAFDDATGQNGTLRWLARAMGGGGDEVALRAPGMESGPVSPGVRGLAADPVPGVTGPISALLRPDGLPGDVDVLIGYGDTAGIADVRRDAYPDARVVQALDVVPTDPAHLRILARADLVIAVGPDVAAGVRSALDGTGIRPVPPVHEVMPPIEPGPVSPRPAGRDGYHVLVATEDGAARDRAVAAVAELRRQGVDARLSVMVRASDDASLTWHQRNLARAVDGPVEVVRMPDDRAGLVDVLHRADVVVDPSAGPRIDPVIVAAAEHGVPVLVAEGSGAGRLMNDADGPVVRDPDAGTEAWTDRLRDSARNAPDERQRAIDLRDRLAERYSPEAVAAGVHHAMTELGGAVSRVDDAVWRADLDPREVLLRMHDHATPPADGRLRVMTVCTEYNSTRGGVITANQEMARGFAMAGAEVYGRVSLVDPGQPGVTRAETGEGVHVRGVQEVWGVVDAKGLPDTRALSMLFENLPPHVDVIVGNSRFGGGAARILADHVYPDAKYVHVLHTSPEVLDAVRGDPAEGRGHAATERALMNGADLVAGIGPLLGEDAARLAAAAAGDGTPPPAHTVISDMPRNPVDPPLRPAGRTGIELYVQGRAGDPIKGVDFAARLAGELRAEGHDVRLVVRGARESEVADMTQRLTALAGHPVEVRPFVASHTPEGKAELLSDLHHADVVLMPSLQEGFGLVASEAARAGVPVVVGEGTGAGKFFGDPRYVPGALGEAATVRDGNTVQALLDAVNVVAGGADRIPPGVRDAILAGIDDRRAGVWADHVRSVIGDLGANRERALGLRDHLDAQYPLGRAAERILDVLRGEAPPDRAPVAQHRPQAGAGAASHVADVGARTTPEPLRPREAVGRPPLDVVAVPRDATPLARQEAVEARDTAPATRDEAGQDRTTPVDRAGEAESRVGERSVEEQRLQAALAERGLADDPMFQDLDGQTVNKVARALAEWPRLMPETLRDRFAGWARATSDDAREFANRVEYARAVWQELGTQQTRSPEFEGMTKKQRTNLGRRMASDLMDSDDAAARLSTMLEADAAVIAGAERSGRLPDGLTFDQVPSEVRRLAVPAWESATAEAYHAHKHQSDLPLAEQDLADPVAAYARSLRQTLQTGLLVRDESSGSSRMLYFDRAVGDTTVRAVVYVKPDGSAVVATYGRPGKG